MQEKTIVNTKCHLFSRITRMWYPYGVLSPSTVTLKILMQDMWKANFNKDDILPLNTLETWNKLYSEISAFKSVLGCIASVKALFSSSVIRTHSCSTRCITKYCLRNNIVNRFYHRIEKILKPPAKGACTLCSIVHIKSEIWHLPKFSITFRESITQQTAQLEVYITIN